MNHNYCIDCKAEISNAYPPPKRCNPCDAEVSCINPIKRFWDGIEKQSENGCWLWKGAKSQAGYGQFTIKGKTYYIHRFSYELHKGTIPKGKFICHTCDIRHCAQILHLFLGTHQVNMTDAAIKGKFAKKLTPEDVEWIRQNYKPRQGGAIARKFGITKTAVYYVLNRTNWKHI